MGKKYKQAKLLKFEEKFQSTSKEIKATKNASWEGWEFEEFNDYEIVQHWDHTSRTFGAIAKFQGEKRFIKITKLH